MKEALREDNKSGYTVVKVGYTNAYNDLAKRYRNSLIAKFDNKNNIVPNYLVFTFDIVL